MSAVTKKQAGRVLAESFPLGMPAAGQFQKEKELEKVPGYRATIARPAKHASGPGLS
jgi:hypothetical protein